MYLISGVLLLIASSFQFFMHKYFGPVIFHGGTTTRPNDDLIIPFLFLIAGIYCIVCHFKYERPKK